MCVKTLSLLLNNRRVFCIIWTRPCIIKKGLHLPVFHVHYWHWFVTFCCWNSTSPTCRALWFWLVHVQIFQRDLIFIFCCLSQFVFWVTSVCGSQVHASLFLLSLQWGVVDAEIKVPSGENTELKRSPFKAWNRSANSHATLTARDCFLAYFYPSDPFTCNFSKTSPDSSCVGCG